MVKGKIKAEQLQPGILLFKPTHTEAVLDALAGYNEAHRGRRRRHSSRSGPVQERKG